MSTQTPSRPVGIDELKRLARTERRRVPHRSRRRQGPPRPRHRRGGQLVTGRRRAHHRRDRVRRLGRREHRRPGHRPGGSRPGPSHRVLLGHRLRTRRGEHRRARPAPDRLASGQARPRPARARQRGPRWRRRGPAAHRGTERDPADHSRRRLGGRPAAGHRLLAGRSRPRRRSDRPGHHRHRPPRVAMDLLAGYWQPEQIVLAVRGPRRKKWPRGLEQTRRAGRAERGGPRARGQRPGLPTRPGPPDLGSTSAARARTAHRHQRKPPPGVSNPEGRPWTS
ncbi:hypothetical protein I601_4160 [Nocardioides dokdonensis FR1436]|uniref:Uncharacterized protein n=1 Tax=Nocardioides dokdonensis FR1436 TaxID=1300347 RepID=A0A1A9GSV0_9ACTN|nr:hypothetical protein I601_4160 [Nocardioides dokdonensis FR1436]